MNILDKDNEPPKEAILALINFLPFFQGHAPEELYAYQPPKQQEGGSIQIGYNSYHPKISEFFEVLYEHNLHVGEYVGKIGWEQLEDEQWIKQADLYDLRLALTFLARSEKWAMGSWKKALEKEMFQQLLIQIQQVYPSG
jgi:hypothetical protein